MVPLESFYISIIPLLQGVAPPRLSMSERGWAALKMPEPLGLGDPTRSRGLKGASQRCRAFLRGDQLSTARTKVPNGSGLVFEAHPVC